MIKAFENFEVWFVTGAQLLYGGDAVVQVDGHSKEMVEGLNNSGNLPVKVVYKGTANSSAEVADVMAKANNESLFFIIFFRCFFFRNRCLFFNFFPICCFNSFYNFINFCFR